MSGKKLITTAIAYANGAPHIGHAFEFVLADVYSRFFKQKGEDIFFITGMDEHGQKIEQKAKEKNIPVKQFVDEYADLFQSLDKDLAVDYDFFVRTSDKEKHYKGAIALWNKLLEKGDLKKKAYSSLYCVGCEEFKTEKDLNDQGDCPDHLKKPEIVEEENYFFNLSRHSEVIKNAITDGTMEILPESRKNEILALLDRGLEDVSFSRPVSKVSWGIPVPGDDTQVMYVWCDALSNYITALGYGTDSFDEERWSNTTHVIGKDILRFHAAIWPGMLLSAGLQLPRRIVVHGHITSSGQKMSKSLGNVIDPRDIITLFSPVTDYPGEVLRFILLHEIPSFEDGDMTLDSIKSVYASYLVNGIGNLTNRIMKMAITHGVVLDGTVDNMTYIKSLESYNAKAALSQIMFMTTSLDKKIQSEEAFKVVKVDPEKGKEYIAEYLRELHGIANALQLFMPQTSAKILECISENKMPEKALFSRLA